MAVIYKVDLGEHYSIEIEAGYDEAYLHVSEYLEDGLIINNHTNINIEMNVYAMDNLIKSLKLAKKDVLKAKFKE